MVISANKGNELIKRILRKTAKAAAIILTVVLAFTIVLTLYHQLSLKTESDKIEPNGQLVDIGGDNLHIYAEGENTNAPALIFLSGAGTAAPVYDFKPLYSLLSGQYRIAVVEKLGYGYADFGNTSRDIDTILAESREALKLAGIEPPYVLMPHSASGLEAIYWATKYPDEIIGVIGLDMATPEYYQNGNAHMPPMGLLSLATFIGLQRIPMIYSISNLGLSNEEFQQAKYLTYRNAVNYVVLNESKNLLENAKTVSSMGNPDVPMLLFCSNDDALGDSWIALQETFAGEVNAELIKLDCGHYIHQFKPEEIADEVIFFLQERIML